jgi:phenylpyruvate tautomerase PptA (4-oxalocrotonate tautomerase family)
MPAATLDATVRQRIAADITRIHCDVTRAPATFVHVVFRDADPGQYMVFGTIRAGRSDPIKLELKQQMAAALAETLAIDVTRITVFTKDGPAAWVMEGGTLLPEPGEEGDWIARTQRAGHADAGRPPRQP